jgi:mycothiol system anti-sigma-R factor
MSDEDWSPPIGPIDPEHPDCAKFIRWVWTLIDGEDARCKPETSELVRHHLEECPDCLRYHGMEERVKLLLATKCRGEKAPEGLVERVRIEISRTTISRTTIIGG